MTTTLPALAVTGSTGVIGGLVAGFLAEDHQAQRLLVRAIERAPQLAGATPVPFDYADRDLAMRALDGVSTLFMVSLKEGPQRILQHKALIDTAVAAGVKHIVYTSFIDASPESTFTLAHDHYETEQYLRASGVNFTILRYNFYSNFLPNFVDNGVLRGPAGDGRLSAVAREDVARSAAAVLAAPEAHVNKTYTLTGPEALTMAEIAQTIGNVSGTPVKFVNETVAEAYESRRAWPAEDWEYDSWVTTYTAIARGELERVSGDVELLTGRPPLTFREVLAL